MTTTCNRPFVLLAALAALAPTPLVAQALAGNRVRATSPTTLTAPVAGEIVALDSSALRLAVTSGVIVTVPRASITRIELSLGRGLGRGFLIGAAAGLVVGAVTGGVMLAAAAEGDELGQAVGGMAGGVAGAIVGIPIGGFAGAALARERWRDTSIGSSTAGRTAPATIEVLPTTRIRVTPTGAERMKGRTVHGNGNLRLESDDRIVDLAWNQVERLEVRGRNRGFGATVGGTLLGGVTFVAATIDYSQDEVSGGEVVFATALNFLIGAGIGALIAPPTWRDVPLPIRR